jgi:hypothetical protein
MSTETKRYTVLTEQKRVAAQRNPGKGQTIELTEEQAAHPLRVGQISLKVRAKPASGDEK